MNKCIGGVEQNIGVQCEDREEMGDEFQEMSLKMNIYLFGKQFFYIVQN